MKSKSSNVRTLSNIFQTIELKWTKLSFKLIALVWEENKDRGRKKHVTSDWHVGLNNDDVATDDKWLTEN